MKRIIEDNLPLEKKIVIKKEAEKIFKKRNEPYKLELLEEIPDDEVTLYQQGEFIDLCRGPHLKRTGEVRFFRLLSLAGSYWRGKEENPMLSRIYGTSFYRKEELEDYLKRLEEAKRRDHRRLGKDLDLFSVSSDLGAGFVIYHPKGALLPLLLTCRESCLIAPPSPYGLTFHFCHQSPPEYPRPSSFEKCE